MEAFPVAFAFALAIVSISSTAHAIQVRSVVRSESLGYKKDAIYSTISSTVFWRRRSAYAA